MLRLQRTTDHYKSIAKSQQRANSRRRFKKKVFFINGPRVHRSWHDSQGYITSIFLSINGRHIDKKKGSLGSLAALERGTNLHCTKGNWGWHGKITSSYCPHLSIPLRSTWEDCLGREGLAIRKVGEAFLKGLMLRSLPSNHLLLSDQLGGPLCAERHIDCSYPPSYLMAWSMGMVVPHPWHEQQQYPIPSTSRGVS